jgi:uncharacterized repeat protein (TIGR03803 family)
MMQSSDFFFRISRFAVSQSGPDRAHSRIGSILMLLLSIGSLVFGAQSAHGQVYQDLHDFGAYSGSQQFPWLMAQGRDNNLYGVTSTGGTHSKGTIFKIGPSGGFTVLHNFDGPHGSTPIGGLTLGLDGNLYGMAEEGGAQGYGNIFRITPAGAFTVLYDFKGDADGGVPVSPLIVGADGNFYGTSYPGAAFRLTPAGAVTVISKIPTYSFGPLLQAKDGTFYGVTEFGGKNGAGTVYKTSGGTYAILHTFAGPSGSYPTGGLVEGPDGNFYGTTTAGGSANAGVVYRISPSGSYRVMIDWDNRNSVDGYQAYAGLAAGADGNLYGATIWGGRNGDGVIFSLTTDGDYSVLYNFDTPHGNGAYASLIQHTNGKLFGITNRGGAAQDGVLYSLSDNLEPFARLITRSGLVGNTVGILGRGFSQASAVEFNGTAASFHVISNTYMTATVPSGETGFVTVETSSGHLTSSSIFRASPQFESFSPAKGKAGDTLTINGKGLIQAINITVGGKAVTQYTVNSDSKLTTKVPAGAKSGKIVVTTPGGTATSRAVFTVTP